MGVRTATFAAALQILRTAEPPAGTDEEVLLSIWPCKGWGTLRVWLFTNQAGTLRIYQKARSSPAIPGVTPIAAISFPSFRQTDTRSVAASPTAMPFVFDLLSDLVRITFQATTTAPTTFEAAAELLP